MAPERPPRLELTNHLPGWPRARTAPEQLTDRILAAMAVGVLQPGERLPAERELAQMLGVSRTTVRLALGRLSALGMTESRRGRNGGTFAVSMQPSDASNQAIVRALEPIRRELDSLFDYRALVEQLIARTAAGRRGPEDDKAMQSALARYQRATSAAESREADHALHSAVAAAAKNSHLNQLAQELTTPVNLGFTAGPYSEDLHRTALRQHTDLVNAITDGDADLAADIAEEHFQMTTAFAWRDALQNATAAEPRATANP